MPGPLAVRWSLLRLPPVRAGAPAEAELELENAGTAPWREGAVFAAYHWLDDRGNAIVWDGLRTPLPTVEPGERVLVRARLRGPTPPGRYRLSFDLVDEHRLWFAEAGSPTLDLDREVAPRIGRRLAAVGGDAPALAAQEEPLVAVEDAEAVALLVPGVAPAPDWSRRVLDAHEEGFGVVGGSVEMRAGVLGRRPPRQLAPYAPGAGRVPAFPHPLVCPSVVRGVEALRTDDVAGLPAVRPPDGEPWLYDGRIRVVVRRPRRF